VGVGRDSTHSKPGGDEQGQVEATKSEGKGQGVVATTVAQQQHAAN